MIARWQITAALSSFLALMALSGCGGSAGRTDMGRLSPAEIRADEDSIRALSGRWLIADSTRNVAAAVSFYAPDAVEMPSNTPIVVGVDAIRAWYQGWLLDPNNSITFATEAVTISTSGDLAMERGTYRFTVATLKGRDVDTGKYLTIWKKLDGAWKVIADINNSDRPLSGGS